MTRQELSDEIDELANGAIRYTKAADANGLLEEVENGLWVPRDELMELLLEYDII